MRKILPIFFALLMLASSAYAARTVIILHDLFLDFSVTSDHPYWLNDSQIVHDKGRINYESDGRYIYTTARTYYTILDESHGAKIKNVWEGRFGGSFDRDVLEHYTNKEEVNISKDMNLKNYWNTRLKSAYVDKKG